MRHRGLALPDGLLEVAAARGAFGRSRDEREQPEANGIGERLERRRQLVGVCLVERR